MSLKSTRKAAVVALPLALVSLVAPFALADGPWDRRGRDDWRHRDDWRDRDRRGGSIIIRPEIVIGRPGRSEVVVVERHYPRQRVEAAPLEVRFKAYQSEDRIIVHIEGVNRSSGFTTTLSSCRDGVIEVCNLAPADEHCAQVVTPFCYTASIHAHCPERFVKVVVAGQAYTVPVTQAQSLS